MNQALDAYKEGRKAEDAIKQEIREQNAFIEYERQGIAEEEAKLAADEAWYHENKHNMSAGSRVVSFW